MSKLDPEKFPKFHDEIYANLKLKTDTFSVPITRHTRRSAKLLLRNCLCYLTETKRSHASDVTSPRGKCRSRASIGFRRERTWLWSAAETWREGRAGRTPRRTQRVPRAPVSLTVPERSTASIWTAKARLLQIQIFPERRSPTFTDRSSRHVQEKLTTISFHVTRCFHLHWPFQTVHRVLETSTRQHDQVQRVADHTEQTDDRTKHIVDEERQTMCRRQRQSVVGHISMSHNRHLGLTNQRRYVDRVSVAAHLIRRHRYLQITTQTTTSLYRSIIHNGAVCCCFCIREINAVWSTRKRSVSSDCFGNAVFTTEPDSSFPASGAGRQSIKSKALER